MLSQEENELLCRVEGAAPMGQMLRRYWLPALKSEELEAGGAPKRVRLLGENLVAFRDSAGRVGLLDENCPHRGASLVLARNEDCGLRCLYHGWKLDVDGKVVETPPEPDEHNFRDRVRALAYPVREAGGLIWTFMGPAGSEPAPPGFEFTALPQAHTIIMKAYESCNWVQSLEGVIDSAHSDFLHSSGIRPVVADLGTSVFKGASSSLMLERPSKDRSPKIETQNTAYGFRYGAIRKPTIDPENNRYIRVTLFVAPIFVIFPAPSGWGNMQAFVPIDDEHLMFYYIKWRYDTPLSREEHDAHVGYSGLRVGVELDEHYHRTQRKENNWLQDRAAMENGRSFTGISGVNNEDMAVQESMGPIYDRRKEHLGTSDVAIIRMRRLMLDSVRRFQSGGTPLGLDAPFAYGQLRAEERIIPKDQPWQVVGAFAGEPTEATV
jgi:phthalate 4,5-dioxygenase oxygenase subunit